MYLLFNYKLFIYTILILMGGEALKNILFLRGGAVLKRLRITDITASNTRGKSSWYTRRRRKVPLITVLIVRNSF